MDSAIFHIPGDSVAPPAAAPHAPAAARHDGIDRRGLALCVLPPAIGLALLMGVWALATQKGGSFPTPGQTWDAAVQLFADPFHRNGPNDQGMGWHVLNSLSRVALGFGLAALAGIPLGLLIGRSSFANRMAAPLIALLKPVSPLAWLPLGLLAFGSTNSATVWAIVMGALWPLVVHTAAGVQRVPQDYLNVARVLRLSEWTVITRVLLPAVLPDVLTGIRLSVGTAWLVVVAAEMLTGGAGVGAWAWDAWRHLNVAHVIVAIVVIGTVGLLLEGMLKRLARHFTFED